MADALQWFIAVVLLTLLSAVVLTFITCICLDWIKFRREQQPSYSNPSHNQ